MYPSPNFKGMLSRLQKQADSQSRMPHSWQGLVAFHQMPDNPTIPPFLPVAPSQIPLLNESARITQQ